LGILGGPHAEPVALPFLGEWRDQVGAGLVVGGVADRPSLAERLPFAAVGHAVLTHGLRLQVQLRGNRRRARRRSLGGLPGTTPLRLRRLAVPAGPIASNSRWFGGRGSAWSG